MATPSVRRLQRQLASAQERIEELEDYIQGGTLLLEPGVEDNPSFFGLFGGDSKTSSKGAKAAKQYYVDFEDVGGNVRQMTIPAANKKEALSQAKRFLREEGENLTGATFDVEAAD